MNKKMSLAEMKSKIEEFFPKEMVEKLKVNNELELYINVVLESLMDMGYSERFLKEAFLLATYSYWNSIEKTFNNQKQERVSSYL